MASKIFISYRRDDSAAMAGRLYDRLVEKFGEANLFIDVDNMPAGADFVKHLSKQVESCDIFLCTVGPNWLNAKDEDGRRRLDQPDDYVRVEIASALNRDIPVIPVLIEGARVPSRAAWRHRGACPTQRGRSP
jgi:TIR domain